MEYISSTVVLGRWSHNPLAPAGSPCCLVREAWVAARSLCSLVCLVHVSGMQRGEAVNSSLMLPSDLCKYFFLNETGQGFYVTYQTELLWRKIAFDNNRLLRISRIMQCLLWKFVIHTLQCYLFCQILIVRSHWMVWEFWI